ncbi:hypothetical protein M444_37520 (plasmid) [Streptomyces sp. Mg1]|nr:hypothetical protein M444_37520 [Streptomyces sp. Mg1]
MDDEVGTAWRVLAEGPAGDPVDPMPEQLDRRLAVGLPGVRSVFFKALQPLFLIADRTRVLGGLVHGHLQLAHDVGDASPLVVLEDGDVRVAQALRLLWPCACVGLAFLRETYALRDLVRIEARRFSQDTESS